MARGTGSGGDERRPAGGRAMERRRQFLEQRGLPVDDEAEVVDDTVDDTGDDDEDEDDDGEGATGA